MKGTWVCLGLALGLVIGCGRVTKGDARALVTRYNEVVSEAYRTGDIRVIDAVVGPNTPDGQRLTGLVGVRQDMGLALDAHLVSLDVLDVAQTRDTLQVHTRETWRYRDVQAATGRQVGEASTDRYEMTYVFKRFNRVWMVDETRFAAPPEVGRKTTPWQINARDAHSMAGPAEQGGKP